MRWVLTVDSSVELKSVGVLSHLNLTYLLQRLEKQHRAEQKATELSIFNYLYNMLLPGKFHPVRSENASRVSS